MTIHFAPGKATFVHVPKCAGTSIKKWSGKISGTQGGPKHWKSASARQKFKVPGTIFAVIRNPYDRAVSLFQFCGQLGTGQINLGGRRPPCYDVWRDLYQKGFQSFLEATLAHDPAADTSDPHWHQWDSQWSWIADAPEAVVLRYESLGQDFRCIQDMLGCHDPLPLENASRHEHYRDYLDSKTIQLIKQIWAEDIDRFGYQP